ncbi:hypothetical protein Psed_6903, partial (plasmid) [Pseudonocardia dioxanivorans CB1190]
MPECDPTKPYFEQCTQAVQQLKDKVSPFGGCGVDVGCHAEQVAQDAFEKIASRAGEAAADLIGKAFTWWIKTPTTGLDVGEVEKLQNYTLPIAAAVLVGSVLFQAIRMTVSRKKDPAVAVGLGLIRYAVITTIGVGLIAAALTAGDQFAGYLVDQGVDAYTERMKQIFAVGLATNPFLFLVLALIGVILAAIQWAIAFIRQAGIVVLAVLLPLAASGSINDSTKVWMQRITPWLLTLIFYKPIAALIYLIGFKLFGESDDLSTMMIGLLIMVLAVIAMPAMMRFFSWSQVAATGGSGAGGALAMGAMGAMGAASLRSRMMENSGPGSAPGAGSGAPSGGAPGGGQGQSPGGSVGRPGGLPGGGPSGAGVPTANGAGGAGGGAA